jgi:hypothetical protein
MQLRNGKILISSGPRIPRVLHGYRRAVQAAIYRMKSYTRPPCQKYDDRLFAEYLQYFPDLKAEVDAYKVKQATVAPEEPPYSPYKAARERLYADAAPWQPVAADVQVSQPLRRSTRLAAKTVTPLSPAPAIQSVPHPRLQPASAPVVKKQPVPLTSEERAASDTKVRELSEKMKTINSYHLTKTTRLWIISEIFSITSKADLTLMAYPKFRETVANTLNIIYREVDNDWSMKKFDEYNVFIVAASELKKTLKRIKSDPRYME